MSILPVLTARKLILVLLRAGFRVIRQKGSHVRLEHPVTKRSTTVPLHVGDVPRGLLVEILKQADLSIKIFLKLLGKK